jgi:hypothetical protein
VKAVQKNERKLVMTKEGNFDPVVLLFLFGLYFVLKYATTQSVTELIYGIVLLIYDVRFHIARRKAKRIKR